MSVDLSAFPRDRLPAMPHAAHALTGLQRLLDDYHAGAELGISARCV